MLRRPAPTAAAAAAVEVKASDCDYRLYLLTDNSPASLAEVQRRVDGGNAVLLYPDPTDKGSSASRKFRASFIQKGVLRAYPDSRLEEVPMGNRVIRAAGALPCDITTQPDSATLIKDALARAAGIRFESSLFKITDVLMYQNVLPRVQKASSLAAFAGSSLYASRLARPELDQRAVEKLFMHIRNGEPTEVKKMLDMNPRLSLVRRQPHDEKANVIRNKAGQCIDVNGKTAYMFALGEDDTEIAAIIKAAILKVANEKEADAQFHAQLPAGWEEEEAKRAEPIFAQLEALTQAIRNAAPGDITSSGDPEYKLTVREESAVAIALAKFRALLDATLNEIRTTGRHFNPALTLRAFQTYDDHYADYFGNNWNDPRAMLFWRGAIGGTERLFPANYIQAACAGFCNTEKKLWDGRAQGRSFQLELYHPGRGWVPGDFSVAFPRLGFDFAVCGVGGWVAGRGRGRAEALPFRSLCQSKTAGVQSLLSTKTDDVRHQSRRA